MPIASQSTTLDHVLDSITKSDPFIGVGVYTEVSGTGQCRWNYLDRSSAENGILDQVLEQHSDSLLDAARNGNPLQLQVEFQSDNSNQDSPIFIAVAAGLIDGMWAGLGYLSQRELSDAEIAGLGPFSRLVAATVENTRLNDLLNEANGRGPFAELIGLIAHELRTPLTGMRGNIQLALMANRKGNNDRVPPRLEAAIATVDHMAEMIQKLLDVSRLERGAYPFQESRADLRVTTSAAIEDTRSQAEQAAMRISLAEGEPVEYLHDQNALQQALSYLLQTVARYINASGEVTVTVSGEENERRIEIAYPGSVLSSSDQSALLKSLNERYERSGDDFRDELSLELAFSRGIVMRHHGGIAFGARETPLNTQLITISLPVEHA